VNILEPGPGVGGHCIPVDPWFIIHRSPERARLIRCAREVNDSKFDYVFEKIKNKAVRFRSPNIAYLGLAFKPDVDDLRESPAIEVVHLLKEAGASITVYEPFKPDYYIEGVKTAASLEEALQGVEAILLLVSHTNLLALNPEEVSGLTQARILIDTVNGWDVKAWSEAGYTLFRLGVGKKS